MGLAPAVVSGATGKILGVHSAVHHEAAQTTVTVGSGSGLIAQVTEEGSSGELNSLAVGKRAVESMP